MAQKTIHRKQLKNILQIIPIKRTTLINQLNGGVSKARNTRLKQASGNFIALLDSDDAWKQKKIEEQVNVFKTCQHVDFLGTGFAGFGINAENGRLQRIFFKDLLFRNYFQPSTILMKREIVDKVGFLMKIKNMQKRETIFLEFHENFNVTSLTKNQYVGDGKSGFWESGLSANLKEMEKGELKNLKFAYENKWIGFGLYFVTVCFSLLKYLRRIVIVKLR